jgi:hypothetical protein
VVIKSKSSALKNVPLEDELGGPARGKIRYIDGYTIAKLKFINSRIIQNSLYVKGREDTLKVAKKQRLNFLI